MTLQDDADSAPKSVLEADSLLPSYLREDPAEEAAALARQLLTLLGLSQAQARQLLLLARALSRGAPGAAGMVGAAS